MNERELVALSDEGYHALNREITLRQGGDVIEEAGMLHVAGRHALPFIANGTMRIDPRVPSADAVERAREYARRYGRQAGMSTHAHDDDLDDALTQAGWDKIVVLGGMIAVDPIEEASPGPDVELRPVEDGVALAILIDVLGQSFGPEEPWPSLWAAVFGSLATIDRPDTTTVIATVSGEPAAAAVGYALDPVGVVGMVGTLPRFGRRGLGNLVTRHVAAAAQRETGRPVVLQSSPDGRSLYERIGFRTVTEYAVWVDRPPRETAALP